MQSTACAFSVHNVCVPLFPRILMAGSLAGRASRHQYIKDIYRYLIEVFFGLPFHSSFVCCCLFPSYVSSNNLLLPLLSVPSACAFLFCFTANCGHPPYYHMPRAAVTSKPPSRGQQRIAAINTRLSPATSTTPPPLPSEHWPVSLRAASCPAMPPIKKSGTSYKHSQVWAMSNDSTCSCLRHLLKAVMNKHTLTLFISSCSGFLVISRTAPRSRALATRPGLHRSPGRSQGRAVQPGSVPGCQA